MIIVSVSVYLLPESIGMSEHSDAVVVIVSEETGSISAAVGGLLKRHLAPETLEQLLRNELMSDKKEETPVVADGDSAVVEVKSESAA